MLSHGGIVAEETSPSLIKASDSNTVGSADLMGEDPLASKVISDFTLSSSSRIYQEQRIFVRAMFNSRAYYDPEFRFPDGTSRVFVNATRPKLQTAVALLMPIICPPGEPPFTIDPDPESVDPREAFNMMAQGIEPDAVREAMFQAAGKKADRLMSKITAGFDFTRLSDKTVRFLWDLSLFGTGIMMGPLAVRNPATVSTAESDESPWDTVRATQGADAITPQVSEATSYTQEPNATPEKKPEGKKVDPNALLYKLGLLEKYLFNLDVISPLDFYPDPAAFTIESSRFAIWRMTLSKPQLIEMTNDGQFKKDVVKEVLEDNPTGCWKPAYWETAINALNNQPAMTVPNGRYTCYNWWGYLTGRDLHEAGVTEIPASRFNERVIANVWVVGGKTVKVAISELHNERLPFFVTPYSIAPNSIWGIGPCESMFDSQDALNSLERALIDNLAVSHAPQLIVDVERLADPSTVLEIKPKKVWTVRGIVGQTTRPVEFYVPDCVIDIILKAMDHESQLAQEQTGLPNFLQGFQGEGTHTRTSTGATLQFNNSVTTLKSVCYNIENTLIVPLVQKLIRFYQMYSEDPMVKGAFRVSANGTRGLMARESLVGMMNDLFQNLGNLPGQSDRLNWGNVFNTYFRCYNMSDKGFVYSDSEYAKIKQQEAQQQQQNAAYQAGIDASVQSVPKQRAELPTKDAIIEMIKTSPENSPLRLAYQELANQAYGLTTPDVKEAMEQQKLMTHLGNLNQAHELGTNISERQMRRTDYQ